MRSSVVVGLVLGLGCTLAGPVTAQFLRWKASATGAHGQSVTVVLEFYRAGGHVQITSDQAADTLITRLVGLGYTVEPIPPLPAALPQNVYLVSLELWGGGGMSVTGGWYCHVQGYGSVLLFNGSGRATLGLEQFGPWVANALPRPKSLSGCPRLTRAG
jgi:hypothetical protein